MKDLTQKQETFCLNMFEGMSQREAWIQAGYSNKYPVKIIDENACRLAAKSKIKARLAELRKSASSPFVATETERKERLSEFIRANIADFISEDGQVKVNKNSPHYGAVSEYEVKRTKHGYNKSLKLHNPISAIAELNRMEHIYEAPPSVNQDNRVINIIVMDEKTKELMTRVKDRTRKLIEGSNATE